METQDVFDIALSATRVYEQPRMPQGEKAVFGFCRACRHGQMENVLQKNHYDDFDLLHTGEKARPGAREQAEGNVPLRAEYYRAVLNRLSGMIGNPGKILDIGCGDGTLMELARGFFPEVKGVEPSRIEAEISRSKGFDVMNAYFDATWTENDYSAFIMTQVLEHLEDPRQALEAAYCALLQGGAGYIDVPNGYKIYAEGRYFDVFAEHINYWSVNGLSKLLNECGFVIKEIGEILGGNHIGAYVERSHDHVSFERARTSNQEKLQDVFEQYRGVSVWGAGVKGRDFIRKSLTDKPLFHLFDSNPNLTGRYVEGCGRAIELPEPDGIRESEAILLTAVEYEKEITQILREQYGYKGAIIRIDTL